MDRIVDPGPIEYMLYGETLFQKPRYGEKIMNMKCVTALLIEPIIALYPWLFEPGLMYGAANSDFIGLREQ